MANATIGDLFTPINAIKSCMERSSTEVIDKMNSINGTIVGFCRSVESQYADFKEVTSDYKDDIVKGFNDLNSSVKAIPAATVASSGMMSSSVGGITQGLEGMTQAVLGAMGEMHKEIESIRKSVLLVTLYLKKTGIKGAGGSGASGGGAGASLSKLPDAKGLKELFDVAVKSKNIKLKDCEMFGMKIGAIINSVTNAVSGKKTAEAMKSVAMLGTLGSSIKDFMGSLSASLLLMIPATIAVKALNFIFPMTRKAIDSFFGRKPVPEVLAESLALGRILDAISRNIVEFTAKMSLCAILGIPAMVGVATFSLMMMEIGVLFRGITTPKNLKEITEGVFALGNISGSILKFVASMALVTILGPPAMIGLGIAVPMIIGACSLMSRLGDVKNLKNVRLGALALRDMSIAVLGFAASLALTTLITKVMFTGSLEKGTHVDPENIGAMAATVPIFFLMLGEYWLFKKAFGNSENAKSVARGSLAILGMGVSTLGFAVTLWLTTKISDMIWKGDDGKTDWEDVGSIARTIPIFGLMLGEYWLYKNTVGTDSGVKSILKGALGIVVMGAATLGFAVLLKYAVDKTKDIWTTNGETDPSKIIGTVALFGLIAGSVYLFDFAGNSVKSVAKGAGAVALVGVGLLVFGFGMSKTVDAVNKAGVENSFKIIGLIAVSAVAFGVMGAAVQYIALGGAAAAAMGAGMLVFGVGLGKYTKVFTENNIDYEQVFKQLLVIGECGVAFAAIGLLSVPIAAGGLSMVVLGAGMASFGLGMSVYNKATKDIKPARMDFLCNTIESIGAVFGAIGLMSVSIAAAGAAMTVLSVGVAAFGGGMKLYIMSMGDIKKERMKELRDHMEKTATSFGLIGTLSVSIAAAGVSMAILSGGIAAFGGANKVYANSVKGLKEEDLKMMRKHIGLMGAEFAALGPFGILIGAGALAMQPASKALISLAKAMEIWKSGRSVTPHDLDMLALTVDRVKLALLGEVDQNGKPAQRSVVGKIIKGVSGAVSAPFDTQQMIRSAVAIGIAGTALKSLGGAISKWKEYSIEEKDLDSFSAIAFKLASTFKVLGGAGEKGDKSLMKLLIGTDMGNYGPNDIETGVRNVKGMVYALNNIGKAILNFRDTVGREFSDETKAKQLGDSIYNVLKPIADAFAYFGDQQLKDGTAGSVDGLSGWLYKAFYGSAKPQELKSSVKAGISYMKGLGKALKDTVEGVKAFADIIPKGSKDNWLANVGSNIGAVLGALAGPLAAFGYESENIDASFTKAQENLSKLGAASSQVSESMSAMVSISKVKQSAKLGVEAIKGLGGELVGIANSLKTFSEIASGSIGSAGTFNGETWTIESEGKGAIGAMQKSLVALFGMFTEFGKTIKESGMFTVATGSETKSGTNVLGIVKTGGGTSYTYDTKSYIGMAVTAVSGIGQTVEQIGNAIGVFAGAKWKDQMSKGTESIRTETTALFDFFKGLGDRVVNENLYSADPESVGNTLIGLASLTVDGLSGLCNNMMDNVFNPIAKNEANFNKASVLLPKWGDAINNINALAMIAGIRTQGNNVFTMTAEGKEYKFERVLYSNSLSLTTEANEARMQFISQLSTLFNRAGSMKVSKDSNIVMLADSLSAIDSAVDKMANLSATKMGQIGPNLAKLKNTISTTIGQFTGEETDGMTAAANLVENVTTAHRSKVFVGLNKELKTFSTALNGLDREKLRPFADIWKSLAELARRNNYRALVEKLSESINLLAEQLRKSSETQTQVSVKIDKDALSGAQISLGETDGLLLKEEDWEILKKFLDEVAKRIKRET